MLGNNNHNGRTYHTHRQYHSLHDDDADVPMVAMRKKLITSRMSFLLRYILVVTGARRGYRPLRFDMNPSNGQQRRRRLGRSRLLYKYIKGTQGKKIPDRLTLSTCFPTVLGEEWWFDRLNLFWWVVVIGPLFTVSVERGALSLCLFSVLLSGNVNSNASVSKLVSGWLSR